MIIAMNCCCSCMIFWIMAMKDYWSWMISTDRCIISWPLKSGRNGFSRGEEHLANQEAADENKSILKLNSIHHHNGREENFTMKVTDVHSSCLDRQVTKRINIRTFRGQFWWTEGVRWVECVWTECNAGGEEEIKRNLNGGPPTLCHPASQQGSEEDKNILAGGA